MIDTAAIRKRVLELAFSGKLTQQLTSDGNGEDLYKEIVEEKKRLVKEKAVKKGVDLPEIKEEEISFDIPVNWKWVRIGEIIQLINGDRGKNYPSKEKLMTEGEIPFISAINLSNNTVSKENLLYMTREQYDLLGSGKLEKGDLVMCIRGSLGKNGIYPFTIGAIASSLVIVRGFFEKEVIHRYISHYFDSSIFDNEMRRYNKGAAQPNLGARDLARFLLPLPPIAEQERLIENIDGIFEILDTIDDLQAQYSSDLEVLKAKIIDAGIQGKLTKHLSKDGTADELLKQILEEKKEILKTRMGRADKYIKEIDEDVPYEIPAHWRWIRFGDIGLFKKGPFGSALTKSMFVAKGADTIKVYEQQHAIKKNSELGTYYISRTYFDESMRGFEVMPGDIIVSCAGTIGETFIMPDEMEQGIINQALMRVTLVSGINKKFFQYYFDANLKKTAQSESNGSAIKNMPPFDVMKNWYFPIPPLEEQNRIVTQIDEILPLCELIRG